MSLKFRVVSATTIKKKIYTKYLNDRACIREELTEKENGKVSFTTDCWTSGNQLSFMAVTCSWLTEHFQMKQVCFALRHMKGKHTGNEIFSVFLNVIEEFGLNDKVVYLLAYWITDCVYSL